MAACGARPDVLTFAGSVVGEEGAIIRRQIDRFAALHPELSIEVRATPDSADQRHQLFVQWLNAWAADPDVLQLDVIWTPEFAAAGWILPLDTLPQSSDDLSDFFDAPMAANRWRGHLFAIPWFVDVGMLYWRTDLFPAAPETFADLARLARLAIDRGAAPAGLVWQGARYEGLVTVFLEYLSGFGGAIMDQEGRVVVDSPAAVRALSEMRDSVYKDEIVPQAVLSWQEEQCRFAFQNGRAAFMRNWPYAASLLSGPESAVAGRFAVAPMPHATGRSAAALGGAQLAINARSRQPEAAWQLIQYLTAPAQMIERAQAAGQFPARRSVYDDERVRAALPIAADLARQIIERAVARPVTPVYTQLSGILQIHLHRTLTRQEEPDAALAAAAIEMRRVLVSAGLCRRGTVVTRSALDARDTRLAWALLTPALAIVACVAVGPLLATAWDSLHLHDLRMPWRGRPFVGLDQYAAALADRRLLEALLHTAVFTAVSVTLELILGLALALALDGLARGRALARVVVLLPWALPTVVGALVWRFMFDSQSGLVSSLPIPMLQREWLADPVAAWVPIVLGDVWKSTPFMALLLLAGLQGIDPALHEAARIDGANVWQRFRGVTLPLLAPALAVAAVFRTLDAFRVFDLVFVLTGGGPGTATEVVSLYTFTTLLQDLRFGYGSALSMLVFLVTFLLAVIYVRLLAPGAVSGAER